MDHLNCNLKNIDSDNYNNYLIDNPLLTMQKNMFNILSKRILFY